MKRKERAFILAQAAIFVAVVALVSLPLNSIASNSSISGSSSSSGLKLLASVKQTTVKSGPSVLISVSVVNTLASQLAISRAQNWTVNGFPVAMWSVCLGTEPVEFMVTQGNSSLDELRDASMNSTIIPIGCMEGGQVDSLAFGANNSSAIATGYFCMALCNNNSEPVTLESNFTVNGYWAYPINGSEANDVNTPPLSICNGEVQNPDCSTYNYPEVGPIAQHVFESGWYTLVVTDEWGQAVVLHFDLRQ